MQPPSSAWRILCALLFLPLVGWAQPAAGQSVLVLPFQGTSDEQVSLGVGIHNLLENMLLQHGGLSETWAQNSYSPLFSNAQTLRFFRHGTAPEPSGIASLPQRWLVRGRMTPDGV